MTKNGQLYCSAIKGHSKRARYKRLLYTQKDRVDTRLGFGKNSRIKSYIFDNRFQMIPLQFYNQHLGGHQMSRRKLSKI